jgi:hypothetical protein
MRDPETDDEFPGSAGPWYFCRRSTRVSALAGAP